MANKIQIKRGSGAPGANVLDDGELGYDTTSKKLYVGNIDENGNAADPTLINKVESVNSKTGAVVLKASDVEAVPTTRTINSKALSGDIELTYTDVKAAPEGYGLGSQNSQLIGNRDFNDIVENGWYLWNSTSGTTLNVPFTAGKMLVVARDGGKYCTQIAFDITKTTSVKVRSQAYDETWSDWVNWSPSAFAPTGYGLGAISYNIPLTTNANDAFRNGWYLINGDTTNGVGYAATLRVEGYSPNYVVQTAYRHTSSKIITWRRYCVSGTWTEWEDITPVAGSGLGVLPLYIDDLNTCLKNGWYAFSDGCANRPENLTHGSVFVINRDSSRTTQLLFGINYTGNPQMIRYTTDAGATWIEDWVNPRMLADTEYRTTDRILGKAVYKKANSNGNVSYRLDGETKWYPERTQLIKLWENNNYTSSFAAQTIQLANWEAFDMIEIIYNYSTDTPTTLSQRAPLSPYATTIVSLIIVSGANNRCGTRRTNVNTDGSISFETAYYNEGTNNKYVVPVAVYGIKGIVDRVPEDDDYSSDM